MFIFIGVVGILFPEKSELAYSVHRIMQALGLGIGFVIGEFLGLPGRCYFVLTAVAIAVVSSIILEFKTKTKENVMPCFYSKSNVSNENGDNC